MTKTSRAKLAALLPPGRHLRMICGPFGPCDKPRVVDKSSAREIIFLCPDQGNKQSYLTFAKGDEVFLTENGFEVQSEGGKIQYEWEAMP